MGKTIGVSSSAHRQVEMKGALGKHIGRYLDQYTFICVFGSVVGYAVMPLIGTIETLVFSVIVIGLSINTVLRRASKEKDERKRGTREDKKSRKSDPKRTLHVQVITDSETRRQRDDLKRSSKDLQTLADEEEAEKERRLEEKREKKARKKEERIKRREEEKKEKEREEIARRERQEQRALKKQQEKEAKEKARGYLFPTYETIKAMVTTHKPVRRERKHSTSSSTSSGSSSTHSHRSHPHTPVKDHRLPIRASSDPLIYPSSIQPTYNQEHLPWGPRSADSTNLSFPRLPTSNKSPPWSAPGHPLPTPHTPHTSNRSTVSSCSGDIWCPNGQPHLTPETLTPGHVWQPTYKERSSLIKTLSFVNTGNTSSDGRHGNTQSGFTGTADSLFVGEDVSTQGNCYSLFSNASSPFMNYTTNDYRGGPTPGVSEVNLHSSPPDYRGHSNNQGNSFVDLSLAVSSDDKSCCSSPDNTHTENKGYDEWPII